MKIGYFGTYLRYLPTNPTSHPCDNIPANPSECEGKWSTSAWADNLKYVGQPASSIIVVMIDDDAVCVKTLKMQEAYDARGGEF
jgi:hypothetical protein